jgi:hypothetical protein
LNQQLNSSFSKSKEKQKLRREEGSGQWTGKKKGRREEIERNGRAKEEKTR